MIIADSENEDVVTGRFLLTDPWWEVECKVHQQEDRPTYWLGGYQAYTLRTSVGKDIVSLFLRKCEVNSFEFIQQFTDWIGDKHINLAELPKTLNKFEAICNVAACDILQKVVKSGKVTFQCFQNTVF